MANAQLIPFQDRQEFEALQAGYEDEIRPQGALQCSIFNELVASAWNLHRIRRTAAELCSTMQSYSELLDNAEIQTELDRIARHKSRIERTFHRSLRELKALQTNSAIGSYARGKASLGNRNRAHCKTNPIQVIQFPSTRLMNLARSGSDRKGGKTQS